MQPEEPTCLIRFDLIQFDSITNTSNNSFMCFVYTRALEIRIHLTAERDHTDLTTDFQFIQARRAHMQGLIIRPVIRQGTRNERKD